MNILVFGRNKLYFTFTTTQIQNGRYGIHADIFFSVQIDSYWMIVSGAGGLLDEFTLKHLFSQDRERHGHESSMLCLNICRSMVVLLPPSMFQIL